MLGVRVYRRHIENRIRPGNASSPWLIGMSRNPSPRVIVNKPLLATGLGLVLLIAAMLVFLANPSGSSSSRSSPSGGTRPAQLGAPGAAPMESSGSGGADGSSDASASGDSTGRGTPADDGSLSDTGTLTMNDGLVPDGVTVFDGQYPAVSKLDPDLLAALRNAANGAGRDGVTLIVNSGWRSTAYQAELLAEAIAQYGSAAEAARWVATPQTSPHVSGDAVDLGPSGADAWLARHGADYGLCRIYQNEPWHFELRQTAATGRCPAPYADPTQDPRMQQG